MDVREFIVPVPYVKQVKAFSWDLFAKQQGEERRGEKLGKREKEILRFANVFNNGIFTLCSLQRCSWDCREQIKCFRWIPAMKFT
ncbi:hypothetical protein V6Z12_A05G388800 [Gossypium hirsutum]